MFGVHKRLIPQLVVVFLLSTNSFPVWAQPEVFVLNSSTDAPYNTPDRKGFLDLIVAEVFRRIGLKAKVESYNASKRALTNANQNIDQGVAMRIKGLEKKYPNLVRVDEPLIQNDFVAYSKNLQADIHNWSDLKPYTVAYIHGWVIFEKNLVEGQKNHSLATSEQMFTMLQKNRVDLVLYERWQGLYKALQSGIRVKVHEPPLASVEMYMYVHRNHAELAPRLADALKSMKADGSYQDIFDRTLKVLTP
jgi:polar amino acid transport system substrate-binding protein